MGRCLGDAAGTGGAVLTSKELVEDPHAEARGFFEPVTHPFSGARLYLGSGIKLSRTPGRIHGPSPLLGQHSRQVLADMLGLTDGECAGLIAEGVVLDPDAMLQTTAQGSAAAEAARVPWPLAAAPDCPSALARAGSCVPRPSRPARTLCLRSEAARSLTSTGSWPCWHMI
ncbi:MAG: CoA transferase [Dehalococcoidia bacterium]